MIEVAMAGRERERGNRMKLLLGFDPGGENSFGWAVGQSSAELPIQVLHTGIASNAGEAVRAAIASVPETVEFLAAAIDAPLFWTAAGRRAVDDRIRAAIAAKGCTKSSGIVQNPNSLQGACLIQGTMTAVLLRKQHPGIVISECHPQVLLWLFNMDHVDSSHKHVKIHDVPDLFLPDQRQRTEHERDATLALFSAWAAVHHSAGWQDLFQVAAEPAFPLGNAVSYWMPALPDSKGLVANRG
jgi:hypothetical protein